MFRTVSLGPLALACLASCPLVATAQTEARLDASAESRWALLPTDRTLRVDVDSEPVVPPGASLAGPAQQRADEPPGLPGGPPLDLRSLRRPRVDFFAEWEPETDGLAISSYDLSTQMPVYPICGPPPPLVTTGYSFTHIAAPAALDLPESLHDFSLGLTWMRRINEQWMSRFMLSGAFASDTHNTSSDAWQIRGGGFAVYRPNQQWSWAFGALATGRDDIPVIPAIGAVWEPSPELKVHLMMPNPRVSLLLAESATRQQWGYLGGGLSGGTWAYDRASGAGERLTYREWRLVLGWESMPPQPPGTFRSSGTRVNAEVGYAFGREFEFDSAVGDISPDDALLLRTGVSF